ncbi:MAG: tetratricopeptide repeat protein [Bacteroidaceae bacterium]|nr:tetratricopeptide repeat protein [Bacteroidaceae bacterium]
MRTTILTVALCLVASMTFAQKKAVSKAQSEAKVRNIGEARNQIKQALENPETKDQAKTWWTAGYVEFQAFDTERNKLLENKTPDDNVLFSAILEGFKYYEKAAELDQLPDEKGKVKPKHLRDIKSTMKSNHQYLYSAGGHFYNAGNFKNAYESFKLYSEVPFLSYMEKEGLQEDTLLKSARFYSAMAAVQMKDPQIAVAALNACKDDKETQNEVYQMLASQYDVLQDTANLIKVYEEGASLFPEEPFYVQNLIAMYIFTNKLDEAIVKLDDATAKTPDNKQLWLIKGQLLDRQEKFEDAVKCYEKVLELDPENAPALGSIGIIYYNQAAKLSDENNASAVNDMKKYKEGRANVVDPAFRKALTYLEKAHKLNPNERSFSVALRNTYYNLEMGPEYEAIDKELKNK